MQDLGRPRCSSTRYPSLHKRQHPHPQNGPFSISPSLNTYPLLNPIKPGNSQHFPSPGSLHPLSPHSLRTLNPLNPPSHHAIALFAHFACHKPLTQLPLLFLPSPHPLLPRRTTQPYLIIRIPFPIHPAPKFSETTPRINYLTGTFICKSFSRTKVSEVDMPSVIIFSNEKPNTRFLSSEPKIKSEKTSHRLPTSTP